MYNQPNHRENINLKGFTVVNDIYDTSEVNAIIDIINKTDQSNSTFRKTNDLFAIRQFLKEVPEVKQLIFNEKLKTLIAQLFSPNYFIVKSIYFDKPEKSNWFVAWHQDLTISVDKKVDLPAYGSWTVKSDQFVVQPPVNILQDNFTIRVHLDDTNEDNGALKIIEGSHISIFRPEKLDIDTIIGTSCNVPMGGIMIMRPLLMHASNRTTSNKQRRVIHIEFSRQELPVEISWAERENY